MEIIAIVNQKGGVAKTTTAINLASSLAEIGKNILLIDIDPQANLTQGIGLDKKNKTTYEVLKGEINFNNAIYNTKIEPDSWTGIIDVIPASIELANAELEFSGEIGRETLLKEAFKETGGDEYYSKKYDYMIIDTNPSLGLLTVNALSISNSLIIPLEPSMFALDGIEQLIEVIKLIRKKINSSLNIKGVLLTRVDGRTNIAKEFEEELKEVFGNKVFDTLIHQNVKISEAQSEQIPINIYDRKARGTKEYAKLAQELINYEW